MTNAEDAPTDPRIAGPAILRYGDSGLAVERWQRELILHGLSIPAGATGHFRDQTHNATLAFQVRHGLPTTGEVGPAEWAAAQADQPPRITPRPPIVPTQIPFLEARFYNRAIERTEINLWVIHCMQIPESSTTAERCARYFAELADTEPKKSIHYMGDCDSIVQGVRDNRIAYHAPGANSDGLGIEHAGYARQSRAEWLDDFGVRMLDLSAELCAIKSGEHGFPLVFVDAHALQTGAIAGKRARGVTTHWEVAKAFQRSDHTDPGPDWPMDYYLERAARFAATMGAVT